MFIYDYKGNVLYDSDATGGVWKDKKAAFIGDSITEGVRTDKTYWEYLKDMLGLSDASGYGVNGARVSGNTLTIYSQIANIPEDMDAVFLFGGTNDFNAGAPLGDWYTTADGERTFIDNMSTFRGALSRTILALIDKFPGKQIILLTPLHRWTFGTQKTDMQANSQELYLGDYVKAIIEAGEIFSVNVIDLYNNSGLFPYDEDNASLYFNVSYGDKLHPTATGHQRIAEVISSELLTIPPTT